MYFAPNESSRPILPTAGIPVRSGEPDALEGDSHPLACGWGEGACLGRDTEALPRVASRGSVPSPEELANYTTVLRTLKILPFQTEKPKGKTPAIFPDPFLVKPETTWGSEERWPHSH